jgi:cytochrome c nitrite reductase small subunit
MHRWAPALFLGAALGVGAYTFHYAKGTSYLSNDPAACANCHAMNDVYAGWQKSVHHNVATCNDCHTPHDLIGKYTTKARNGFWHSYYFTRGNYPDVIQITERSRTIAENNCRRCHAAITDALSGPHGRPDSISCLQCHQSPGHP